ncbi:LOW QUALITY PROTEIN: taste receptor type 2 member 39-like [Rhynchocyon petersi]
MMLEILLSSTFPHLYNQDVVHDTFKISFMFLNYCSLWFAAWLSFFYFVKISDFSYPLLLKLKWKISGWMPWLLWLSVLKSLAFSAFFCMDIYTGCCRNSSIPSSDSIEKKHFTKTGMVTRALLCNLGILLPFSVFILAATLLIVSLKRHTLHMKSKATGSGDPSMQTHKEAIKSISYFLILYIFNAISLFICMSDVTHSAWTILCKIVMVAYPAGHSALQILGNFNLRRGWKQLRYQAHLYLSGQTL